MKTVCRVLGLARSHVRDLHHCSEDWKDGRKGRTPTGDAQLLAEIKQQIADLPSYGYGVYLACSRSPRPPERSATMSSNSFGASASSSYSNFTRV